MYYLGFTWFLQSEICAMCAVYPQRRRQLCHQVVISFVYLFWGCERNEEPRYMFKVYIHMISPIYPLYHRFTIPYVYDTANWQ